MHGDEDVDWARIGHIHKPMGCVMMQASHQWAEADMPKRDKMATH